MPASGSTGSARAGGSRSPCSIQNSAILRASPLGGLHGFGDATPLGDKPGNVGARSQKAAGGQLLDAGADGGLVHQTVRSRRASGGWDAPAASAALRRRVRSDGYSLRSVRTPRIAHGDRTFLLGLRAVRCRSFARCERLSWDVPGFSFLNTDFIDASSGIEQGGAPRTTDSFMFDVSSSAVSISKASRSGSPRQPIAAGAWVDPGRRAGGGRLGEPCI